MTKNEMIHEKPHMRYLLESAKHKETLDEIKEVLRHHKEINEVLDKIFDEVCDIDDYIVFYPDSLECKAYVRLIKVMEIIDKYRAESEDKNE